MTSCRNEVFKYTLSGCTFILPVLCSATKIVKYIFYWTVTVQIWIMHVDIWSPLHAFTNNTGDKGCLIHYICDLPQIVISSITFYIISVNSSRLFMSEVVLSFGMLVLVGVDYDSTFKQAFIKLCKSLKLTY